MTPIFFPGSAAFREWLERHHATETELWIGFYRKAAGRISITYPESVDEALCFGWIDGVRRKLDEESYTNRFTPRRPGSNWSAVNIRKVEELIAAGRMTPVGLRVFENRKPTPPGYSFEERGDLRLDDEMEAGFRANPEAWAWWTAAPAGYRRTITHWVLSAKQEATRARRLETLIANSAVGRRVG